MSKYKKLPHHHPFFGLCSTITIWHPINIYLKHVYFSIVCPLLLQWKLHECRNLILFSVVSTTTFLVPRVVSGTQQCWISIVEGMSDWMRQPLEGWVEKRQWGQGRGEGVMERDVTNCIVHLWRGSCNSPRASDGYSGKWSALREFWSWVMWSHSHFTRSIECDLRQARSTSTW